MKASSTCSQQGATASVQLFLAGFTQQDVDIKKALGRGFRMTDRYPQQFHTLVSKMVSSVSAITPNSRLYVQARDLGTATRKSTSCFGSTIRDAFLCAVNRASQREQHGDNKEPKHGCSHSSVTMTLKIRLYFMMTSDSRDRDFTCDSNES